MPEAPKSEVGELNHQKFKLAAAGTGIIACAAPKGKWRKPSSLKVLLAMRDASVGEGFGITGGGFVECAAVDLMQVGSIVDIAVDAYRENDEETKRFFEFITQGAFLDRVQGITNVAVRTSDLNRVHACMFYALALAKKEWKKLKRFHQVQNERVRLFPQRCLGVLRLTVLNLSGTSLWLTSMARMSWIVSSTSTSCAPSASLPGTQRKESYGIHEKKKSRHLRHIGKSSS